ncbi:MaoC family dehydratase [Enemella sp. A6]|uniref:MaoC family dehydratase n=1 Tax=Enemella sp. A6 TaxID=3440152 RepID=UPI003EBA1BF3
MTAVGDELPALTVTLTRADLVRYAGASGDFNPIHWSDRFATALGMPGVLAHGMLTMGLALRVVTDWAGDPARVRSYQTRFARPVVVPDTDEGVELTITGKVTAVDDDAITVGLEVISAGEKILTAARAELSHG